MLRKGFVPQYISCSFVRYDFVVLFACSHYKIHRVPLFPQNPWETLADEMKNKADTELVTFFFKIAIAVTSATV